MTLTAPSPNRVSYLGYSISLAELEPYPIVGREIAPEEYMATLMVTKQ